MALKIPVSLRMAGIAQPDEVLARVGFRSRSEVAERALVVDVNAGANMRPAVGAVAGLLGYYRRPDLPPVWPANGRRTSCKRGRSGALEARGRAEARAAAEAGRAGKCSEFPRLLLECAAAVLAGELDRRHPFRVATAPNLIRRESVSGAKAKTKLVAEQARLRASVVAQRHNPFGPTGARAEPGCFRSVRSNGEGLTACFARQMDDCSHAAIIVEREPNGNYFTGRTFAELAADRGVALPAGSVAAGADAGVGATVDSGPDASPPRRVRRARRAEAA